MPIAQKRHQFGGSLLLWMATDAFAPI